MVPRPGARSARRAERLDRRSGGSVRSTLPRGDVGLARCAGSCGATQGRTTRPTRCWRPFVEFGSPLLYGARSRCRIAVLQTAFDGLLPTGLQWYWKADIFEEIPDAAIAFHRRYGESLPSSLSTMHLYPISGAAERVPDGRNCVRLPRRRVERSHRRHRSPDPANLGMVTEWATGLLGGPAPDLGRRRLREHDDGRGARSASRSAYRGNYERLVEVKRSYDPDNLFRINQNVSPD